MKIEPRPARAPKWYVFNKNLIENQWKSSPDQPWLQKGRDEPREFHGSLTYRQANAAKNKVSRGGGGAEPCVFMCFFLSMFPKPHFLHAFQEKSAAQAAIHWATARPNQTKTTAKTQGFGNWLLKTIVKNQGSASVECANLNFCSVFLSLTWRG